MKNYEINSQTLAILNLDFKKVKIIERDNEFIINKSVMEIIDHSCKYFGSSYEGRHKGTKNLIGVTHKSPIIIEETKEIIFFPTMSPRQEKCSWISLKNIEDYKKDNKKAILKFKNGVIINIPISFGSLENQIFRATRLDCVLRERKLQKK